MVLSGLLIGYTLVNYTDIQINSVITEEWKNVFFDMELGSHWSGKYEVF
jgi:hypothetical protein